MQFIVKVKVEGSTHTENYRTLCEVAEACWAHNENDYIVLSVIRGDQKFNNMELAEWYEMRPKGK